MRRNQSRGHGGLWWAYAPKQSSKPPKFKYEILSINGILLNLNVKLPLQKRQASIDDFLVTVLEGMLFAKRQLQDYKVEEYRNKL